METQTPYNAGGKPTVVIQISADTTFSCLCHLAGVVSGVTPQEKAANARALMEACMDEYKKIVSVEIKAALQPPKRPSAEEIYLPPLPADRHDKAVADARNMIANIKSAALAQEGEQDFKQITDSVLEKLRADYDLCPTIQMLGVDREGAFIWMAAGNKHDQTRPLHLFIYRDDVLDDRATALIAYNKETNINARYRIEKISESACKKFGLVALPDLEDMPDLTKFSDAVHTYADATSDAFLRKRLSLADEGKQDLTPVPPDDDALWNTIREGIRGVIEHRRFCRAVFVIGEVDGKIIWMAVVRLYPQKVKRQSLGVLTFNGSKHFAYCPISDSQNIIAEINKIRNQYNITSPMPSADLFIKEVEKFAAIPVLPEMSDDEAVESVDTCYGLWHTPKAF